MTNSYDQPLSGESKSLAREPVFCQNWDEVQSRFQALPEGSYLIDSLSDESFLIKPSSKLSHQQGSAGGDQPVSATNDAPVPKDEFFSNEPSKTDTPSNSFDRVIRTSLLCQAQYHGYSLILVLSALIVQGHLDNIWLFSSLRQSFEFILPQGISLLILKACFFVMIIAYGIKYFYYRFQISNTEVYCSKGLLTREDSKVHVKDIKAVNVSRNFINMITNTGDVEFLTAGSDQAEVIFKGVFDPKRYQKIIEESEVI